MVQAIDIGWGSYRGYEGPFFRGTHPLLLPQSPSQADRVLAVITATEGGHYDAINMYDGQIVSSGLIQFIERAQFSVSQMLGASMDEPYAEEFLRFVKSKNASFTRGAYGRYRFLLMAPPVPTPVENLSTQRRLFYLNATGEKGSWDDASRQHAKEWAAAIASFWQNPVAQWGQREFTMPKLYDFAVGKARDVVEDAKRHFTPMSLAFIAAYLSFAVNNPQRASKHLAEFLGKTTEEKYTKAWLVGVLKELTFAPGIAIYPHRYNAIRPKLEQLYGVELPDFADELEAWKKEKGFTVALSTVEVQKALLTLGYDLGPKGADGQYGPKTREAVLLFEQAAGLPSEVCDGMVDEHTYPVLEQALLKKGLETFAEKA